MKKLGIAGELLSWMMENKKWWLAPAIIVFVLLGVLLVFAQSSPAAPFIYTLF